MPMELPSWLQNNDRGFLAGAQFGAGVFREGQNIKAMRERAAQEAELHPLRVEGARMANKLAEQRFDLQAALVPLKIKGEELQNEATAARLVDTNLGIDLKSVELADQTQLAAAKANWELGVPTEPNLRTPQMQAAWITWKANTDAGRAMVQNDAAKKEYATKLIDAETKLIQMGYTGDTRLKDAKGNMANLPDPNLVAKGYEWANLQKVDKTKPVVHDLTINGKTYQIPMTPGGAQITLPRDGQMTPQQILNATVGIKKQINKLQAEADASGEPSEMRRINSEIADWNALLRGLEDIPAKEEAAAATAPKVGTTVRGYEFLGGDPSKPESWRKVQ